VVSLTQPCWAVRSSAPRIDQLLTSMRSRLGHTVVQKEGALRHLLRALKENNGVGVIMDQHGGQEGKWVPFFGREGSTVDTCARLHLKVGAPMLCNFMLRQSDGRYLWRCREIQVPPSAGQSQDEQIHQILLACNREFEEAIRAAPEQWIWMHKRWRPKPQPEPRPSTGLGELSSAVS
jgi:Kdo2-lipid IVA lauroyltransferase/acyltransferase